MLWILLIVPILIVLYLYIIRRRRGYAARFAHLSMIREAMGGKAGFRRHIPPLLALFAFIVMITALARPAAIITLPSKRGTIILTMDISGSMRANDIAPSRIAASLSAARAFVEKQPENVRIGVVAFAGTANIIQQPTVDREEVLASIGRIRTQRGTAIGSGLLTSLMAIFEDADFDLLPGESARGTPLGEERDRDLNLPKQVGPGEYASAIIVLLTDGQATAGPDPIEAAEQAASFGVRVYTVGLGTTDGVILGFGGRSMRVQLDENTLKTIARTTGGEYFRAGTGTDLEQVYSSLSTQLVVETEKTELTALFTGFAAVLLLIAGTFSMLWFKRII